jgi:stress-induced morphogen
MYMMTNTFSKTRTERIHELVMTALAPTHMLLTDESAQHRGHKGVAELKKSLMQENDSHEHIAHDLLETHLALEISSVALNGLSRVIQHQRIYELVADEFKTGLHSFRIKVM